MIEKLVFFLSLCSLAFSQSLEPRLYSNAPKDMNFLVLGYAYTQGSLSNIEVLGLSDANLGVNIFGAPALSLKEFPSYKQDTIVGVSLQVTMPTGQYDATKLVNLSPHRCLKSSE